MLIIALNTPLSKVTGQGILYEVDEEETFYKDNTLRLKTGR